MRIDGRLLDQLRQVSITPDVNKFAEGSVLIQCGDTQVICTATVEEKIPPFLKGTGQGWVTAEYSMLPRATGTRNIRESARGKIGGRTYEIQRLIGRALRSVVDLKNLGERSIWLDCDVIQADGGTRTVSLTGAFVAMAMAMEKLVRTEKLEFVPITDFLAAVSVGIVDNQCMLDLQYLEDSRAQVDMNIVMTGQGEYVEIQGTAEQKPFNTEQLAELLSLANAGILSLVDMQAEYLPDLKLWIPPPRMMTMIQKIDKLVIATLNKHKVDEIQDWFSSLGVEVLALSGFSSVMPPETGQTFSENAIIKARYGFEVSGLPALADDSGLEVDALGGAPGVYSARYAGEDANDFSNNHKLLKELQGIMHRNAHFRCAMALVTKDTSISVDGICSGLILETPRGTGGFGYDPLFWLPDQNLSMAELSQSQKNQISHRARALANLLLELQNRGWV